ncbi:BatD family protein [Fibrobacter sp. UWB12]|uniref:BatD family protein n=1 Tax=Fibrobacter sp. UWB12 TaxID=1896203 RepID=UPI000911D1C5|nr:BatD family protein [Fibrobacter sp. UWB12]SHK52322.1 Oxygen tolerance [Fibrobacter sp. UWB12]
MKRFLILCLGLIAFANATHKITIKEDRIEAGQTFHLQLQIPLKELPKNRSTPRLKTRNDFKLLGLDSAKKPMTYEALTTAHAGHRITVDTAQIYTFQVKAPQKTGQFDLGSLSWKVNGKQSIISDKYQVTISRPYSAPALEASMTSSKQRVYEGEQFGISFELHSYENCMGVLGSDSVDFGNNFTSYRNDNLKTESKSFGNHESLTTIPFAWWLIPNKSGTLEIPAYKFKYTSKSEPKTVKEEKQVNGHTYTSTRTTQEHVEKEAFTAPISITVLPLPTRGMPTDFSGMVGSYKFKVSFDRTKIKIGESLTLIINISGDGAIGKITNPKLPDLSDFRWELPEIDINERIEDTKVITTKDIKMALYPRNAGTFKIPAITYSWFNPSKKKYEKASAGPWTIEVE